MNTPSGHQPETITYPELPNQRIIPLDPDAAPLIRITSAAPPDPSSNLDWPAIDARWQQLRARNPRYFDGPILAFHSLEIVRDPAPITLIHAVRSSYKLLAVTNPPTPTDPTPPVHTGVTQLSITAVITARDTGGRPHVLLGKRGTSTRIYGDQWELGPSGGIEPPPDRAVTATLEDRDILKQVRAEIDEELHLATLGRTQILELLCLTHDTIANSLDLVYHVDALHTVNPAPDPTSTVAPANWEYTQSRWTPIDTLRTLDTTLPLIPPTRALFRYLRWM